MEQIPPLLATKSWKLCISLLPASVLVDSQPLGNFAALIQALIAIALGFLLLVAVDLCFVNWQNPSCSLKASCKFPCAVDMRALHLGWAVDIFSSVSFVLVCAHLWWCGCLEAAPLKQRPISWCLQRCRARSIGACLLQWERTGPPICVLGPVCEFKLLSAPSTFQKSLELQS